jgi:hypothetical protein
MLSKGISKGDSPAYRRKFDRFGEVRGPMFSDCERRMREFSRKINTLKVI